MTTSFAPGSRLRATGLHAGYSGRPDVLQGVDVEIPDGELTVIIGPNACGKSTLLKALAGTLAPREGEVLLDGAPIQSYPVKELARTRGLLLQSPVAPEGITVFDLVARGRYPHRGLFAQWSAEDDAAVQEAMLAANVDDLAERNVDELSGGQRQRVWIAMALAQQTPLLLLDEPTSYLDISHQVEVLNIARRLHRDGRTVLVVLHDLHLAFRYATHLIIMREGRIVAQGTPDDIVDASLIERVYNMPCEVIADPLTGRPLVLPANPDAADRVA